MGAAVQHLGDGIDLEGYASCEMSGREVLHIEFAFCVVRPHDGSCCLPLPVEAARPVREDAPDGFVAIVIATEDEDFPSHIADFEVGAIVDEETTEAVLPEQLLNPCVIGILHLVPIGSMKHVDDDKFGGMGLERIAEELQGVVEPHLGGHDAMMDVDVVFIDAGTQVEGSHADVPLLGDVEVLGSGIAIAKHP